MKRLENAQGSRQEICDSEHKDWLERNFNTTAASILRQVREAIIARQRTERKNGAYGSRFPICKDTIPSESIHLSGSFLSGCMYITIGASATDVFFSLWYGILETVMIRRQAWKNPGCQFYEFYEFHDLETHLILFGFGCKEIWDGWFFRSRKRPVWAFYEGEGL